MPCYDGRESWIERNGRAERAQQIACYLLATLEQAGYPIPREAQSWWREHKEHDAQLSRTPEFDLALAKIIRDGGNGERVVEKGSQCPTCGAYEPHWR